MKKAMFIVLLAAAAFMFNSCAGNSNEKTDGTHQHDDGSTHTDHADTSKPVQQEFNMTDSTKKDSSAHTHEEGKEHSH